VLSYLFSKVKNRQFSGKSVLRILGYLFTILLVSTYQLHPYLTGNLIGDPFDGRLMVVLHEHWVNFLKGNQGIRDTGFFYPIQTGLGFSDAFIFQGLIYVFIRLFVSDLLTSWAITNSIVLILGNIGLAFLSREIIKKYYLRIFMIIATGTSFSYLSHFFIATNVNGYILTIYSALFLIKIFQHNAIKNSYVTSLSIIGIAIVFPLQLLSGWYASFYSALFILVLLIISLILNTKSTAVQLLLFIKNINKKALALSVVILIILVGLWAYIYIPSTSEVIRSKEEILDGSPSLRTFLKSNYYGGGIFSFIHQLLSIEEFPSYDKANFGLTISVLFSWIFSGFCAFKFFKHRNISYIWITSTLVMLIFVKFGDFSLFSALYQFIPQLGSVRSPIRYLSIFAVTNMIIFIVILDNLIIKKPFKSFNNLILIVLLTILCLDQLRFDYPSWKRIDYNDSRFEDQYSTIKKNCTSFYIDSEGMEWWDDQLTGMFVSAKLGVPTFNGYSGGFPKDFPNQAWRSKTDLLAFGKWLNINNASKGSCIVRNTKVEPFDTPVFIQSASGFDLLESSRNNTWRWATSNYSEYKLINYRKISESGQVKFEIKPAQCLTNLKLNIKLGNWENKFELATNETQIVTIPVKINPESAQSINFTVENELCNFEKDPRLLAFNVLNAKFISD
jgi:hypothetical protein